MSMIIAFLTRCDRRDDFQRAPTKRQSSRLIETSHILGYGWLFFTGLSEIEHWRLDGILEMFRGGCGKD